MLRHLASWSLVIALLGLLTASVGATDLSGTWIGTIAKRNRVPAHDVAFQLIQRGTELGGKAYNESGTSDPIVSGRVEGGSVWFDVEAREQAGNQINIVIYKFKGRMEGSEIAITREKASARDAASGTDVPVRRPADSDEQDRERRFRDFRLERLF